MNERLHEPAAAGVLTSRIGRRFIALFTGCALLPLVVFAWLAASRTAEQMRAEQQAMLHNHAKTTGMGVAARLSQVAGDLALAREFLPRLLDDPSRQFAPLSKLPHQERRWPGHSPRLTQGRKGQCEAS